MYVWLQGQLDENGAALASNQPVGASEDWVVLDSGKSFAWSAKQQGSAREQLEALRNIIGKQQQQQKVLHARLEQSF